MCWQLVGFLRDCDNFHSYPNNANIEADDDGDDDDDDDDGNGDCCCCPAKAVTTTMMTTMTTTTTRAVAIPGSQLCGGDCVSANEIFSSLVDGFSLDRFALPSFRPY